MAGKYESLFDYLSGNQNQSIRLTFSKIEQILGDGLPPSARLHPEWWANDRTSPGRQSQSWLRAGWETYDVDLASKKVSFVRVGSTSE